jgi:hypothetical protein
MRNRAAYRMQMPIAENDTAFNDLLYQGSSSGVPSILGLSVFFGRTMYFVYDGQESPLGTGPINAMRPQGTPCPGID